MAFTPYLYIKAASRKKTLTENGVSAAGFGNVGGMGIRA